MTQSATMQHMTSQRYENSSVVFRACRRSSCPDPHIYKIAGPIAFLTGENVQSLQGQMPSCGILLDCAIMYSLPPLSPWEISIVT